MSLPLIVIVGADKGGVGKTTIARAMMDYFKANGMDCRAFDGQHDTPGGVLKRFFPGKTEVVDVLKSDDQMKVFDTLARSAVTLIDLPAGALSPMLKGLGEMGFFDMVAEGKIRIAVFHVIGSNVASMAEIKATAEALAGAKHFVVTNHMNDASFFAGIDGVAKDALKAATVIDIPKLDERATEFVDAASMPFADFVVDENKSLVMRGKVRHWLATVFAQINIARLTA